MTESGSMLSALTSTSTSYSKSNDTMPMPSQPLTSEGHGDNQTSLEEAPTPDRCEERDKLPICSLIYTACLTVAAVAWMIFHSIYVSRGDNNLTFRTRRQKYPWLYAVAFCLPSVDGVVHLFFTLWNVYRHVSRVESKEDGNRADGKESLIVAPWNFKFDCPLWTFSISTTLLILIRSILIWCIPGRGEDEGSYGWILAVGSLIEALPHFTPMVLLYARTSKMYPSITIADALLTNPTDDKFLSIKSVAAYQNLANFADRKTWNWQAFIVITISCEIVIVLVQYLWLIMHPMAEQVPDIALLTLVEGCYIAFKLWPLVRFNRIVKLFANDLVIKSREVDNAHEDARFRRAVSTTSILFVTQPPCLKVLGVAVDNATLVALFLSVTFTSTSSYILKAAKLG